MALKFKYGIIVSFLICFSLTGNKSFAQKDIHFLLENFIPFRFNPAYTGEKDLDDLILVTRQQWTGFTGAPASYLLATHLALRDKNASVGADIQKTYVGPVNETRIFFDYSYKVILGDNLSLYLGLKGGVDILQVKLSDLVVIDQGDKFFENDVNNIIMPNVGSGFHLVYKNYYFDLSVPRIIRNNLRPRGVANVDDNNKEDRIIITGGGAKFRINDDVVLHPDVALWLVAGAPPMIDTRISASYRKIDAGFIYRPGSCTGGYADYLFGDDIKIGYAYELSTSRSGGIKSGSHEIYLGYNFSFTKQKTLSPRRF